MGFVISVVNEKGGVGKTTCTYNLAVALAREQRRVLMIDLDHQCSLTLCCGYKPDLEEFNGYNVINLWGKDSDMVDESYFTIDSIDDYCIGHPSDPQIQENIFLVPGSLQMAEVETRLYTMPGIRDTFIDNVKFLSKKFHYILIDCPPALNIPMTTALITSDGVIIPVRPEALDYFGLQAMDRTISAVRDNLNPELTVIGTILNLYRANVNTHKDYYNKLSEDPDRELLGVIRESTLVTKGFEAGLPVVLTSPSCQPTQSFNEIARKILNTNFEREG